MLKKLKKCTSLALCILAIGGGSAVANADSSEMGPQPRAIYRYGSQILTGTSYLGGGEGTIFRNARARSNRKAMWSNISNKKYK